jgi:peptide/nickel transport system substrate-binding protein
LPGPQTNPVSRNSLQTGGDLTLAVSQLVDDWNPWNVSPFALPDALDAMLPRLFIRAADGTLAWDATWLASEPAVTYGRRTDLPTPPSPSSPSSPASPSGTRATPPPSGPMTVVYNLAAAAVWSDGTPLTAADFRATWAACAADPGPGCADRGFAQITGVSEGQTPQQVIVDYDSPYPDWANTFARGPLRDGTITADRWVSPSAHAGAYSGPFRFASLIGNTLTLQRNPLWWGNPPLLDRLKFTVIEDLSLAYLTHTIDGFWTTDPNLASQLSQVAGQGQRRGPGADGRYLAFNCSSGPLADTAVRQAVAATLDRGALAASDLAGWAWTGPPLNSPLWLTGQPEFTNLAAGKAADAAALLDAAGWLAGTDGVRTRSGTTLAWDFVVPTGDALAENEALGLRVQLAAIGIRLNLKYADAPELADALVDGGMTATTWHHTTALAAAEKYVTGNPLGYSSAAVDDLARRAAAAPDAATQTALLATLAETVWRDAPVIPLYDVPDTLLIRTTLANYGPDGLGTTLWENVGWTR